MPVIFHNAAAKYLERLNAVDKDRIKVALGELEKDPSKSDIRPYIGASGIWRLKARNYRVLYKLEEKNIVVTHIEPRGQAYTKKTKTKRG